ncbi:MAG: hypothetical protein CVV27_00295, partial [Candidatus Melainabacteria bacterium HGW-Melainabacteria-1]
TAAACHDFVNADQPKTFYLNGIRTPEASAREALRNLESKTGQPIELIYNPTQGLLSDAAESIANLSGVDTGISRKAQASFREALDKGEKVKIYAHSQGAAIAADALHKVVKTWREEGLNPDQIRQQLSRVEVVGFGGFTTAENFPKGVKVQLYKQANDFIPKFGEALSEIGKAVHSKEDDLLGSIGRFGQTIGGFVAVNTSQALRFLAGKPAEASGCTGKSVLDDLAAVCRTVGKVVGSDHDMVVKENFIRRDFSAGYLAQYDPKASRAPIA